MGVCAVCKGRGYVYTVDRGHKPCPRCSQRGDKKARQLAYKEMVKPRGK